MPLVVPVTETTMNYASVVFVGFTSIAAIWYYVYARKHYSGPPVARDADADTDADKVRADSLAKDM